MHIKFQWQISLTIAAKRRDIILLRVQIFSLLIIHPEREKREERLAYQKQFAS